MVEAEEMFSHCNFMNPRNSEVWGYLSLVLLKKNQPELNAAYQCMNEAIKLRMQNQTLIDEIFDEWVICQSFKGAKEALSYTILNYGKASPQKLIDFMKELEKISIEQKEKAVDPDEGLQ